MFLGIQDPRIPVFCGSAHEAMSGPGSLHAPNLVAFASIADRYTTWSIWISFFSSQIKFDKCFYEYDFQSIAVSNYEFGFPNSAPACLAVSPSFQAPLQNTQHKHTAMFHHNQAIKLSRQSCPLSIVMSLNPCHAIIRTFHHFVILKLQ